MITYYGYTVKAEIANVLKIYTFRVIETLTNQQVPVSTDDNVCYFGVKDIPMFLVFVFRWLNLLLNRAENLQKISFVG